MKKPMTGEVGTFEINGEQIGGVRGWVTYVELKPPIHSYVMAAGFWIVRPIETNRVTLRYRIRINKT